MSLHESGAPTPEQIGRVIKSQFKTIAEASQAGDWTRAQFARNLAKHWANTLVDIYKPDDVKKSGVSGRDLKIVIEN